MIKSVKQLDENHAEIILECGVRFVLRPDRVVLENKGWMKISVTGDAAIRKVQSDCISPKNPEGELSCLSSVAVLFEKVE